MIHFQKSLVPKNQSIFIGISGGVDSIVGFDFLYNNGKRSVIPVFINHLTSYSKEVSRFLPSYLAQKYNVETLVFTINPEKPVRVSPEMHWRNERYTVFNSLDGAVVLCHHLDDAVETWVLSSIRGESKLIPEKRDNIIRPFLRTRKENLIKYAINKGLEWVEDESNCDITYQRNLVRHKMMYDILSINPGIHKTIRKKYERA